MRSLNVCGLSRILVPAFFIGMAVTSFTGNETAGWVATGLVATAFVVIYRVRGTGASCALPASSTPPEARTEPGVTSANAAAPIAESLIDQTMRG